MAGPNLEVVISAKVDGLERGVNQAQKTLHQFAGSTEDVDKAMAELDSRLRVIQGNAELFGRTLTTDVQKIAAYRGAISDLLSKGVNPTSPRILDLADKVRVLNDEASEAPAAFNKMNRSMGQGQSAAISFNRVIQDAPFGIMGVSNNITQLAEQFVYLKQSTGSSSAAFKSALGALFSPMNLVVLGISAITSALTVYSMRSRSAKDETKEFADTLDTLSKATLKGNQEGQREIVTLRALYSVTQDTNLAYNQRLNAVKKIQSDYPDYFGNMRTEQILTGQAQTAYARLTAAMLSTGRARAAIKMQEDQFDKLVEIDFRDLERIKEIPPVQAELAKMADRIKELGGIVPDPTSGQAKNVAWLGRMGDLLLKSTSEVDQLQVAYVKLYSSIGDAMDESKKDTEERVKIQGNINKLQELYNESIKDGASVLLDYGGQADKSTEKIKRMSDQIYKLRARFLGGSKQMPALTPPEPMQLTLEIGSIKLSGIMNEMELAAEQSANLFNQTFGRIMLGEDTEKEIADKVQAVRGTLSDMLGGIAGEIGAAIGSGGNLIEAFGKGVIDAFGKFLTNFGKKLVDYGLAAGAFAKLQLAMLNPFTALPAAGLAVAAGLVLMAAGAAASSAASGMGNNVAGQGSQTQNFTSGTVVRPAYADNSNELKMVLRNGDLMAAVNYGVKTKGR